MTILSIRHYSDGRAYTVVSILKAAGFTADVVSSPYNPATVIRTDAPETRALSSASCIGAEARILTPMPHER